MTIFPITDPHEEVRPRRVSRRATGADAVFTASATVVGASVLVDAVGDVGYAAAAAR